MDLVYPDAEINLIIKSAAQFYQKKKGESQQATITFFAAVVFNLMKIKGRGIKKFIKSFK